MREVTIFWKEVKIALKDIGELLSTNFGRGGMKKSYEDYRTRQAVASIEAALYNIELVRRGSDEDEEYEKLWSYAMKGKMSTETLLRTATAIRGTIGWDDLVDTLSVHAYVAKAQHGALVEEKRRWEASEEESTVPKRQTRSTARPETESSTINDEVMDDVTPRRSRHFKSASKEQMDTSSQNEDAKEDVKPKKSTKGLGKEKGKSPSYKLQSDIEAATDLKGVLEEKVLSAKVEFTLREILGITKKEFHEQIIDIIKRKRQLTGDTALAILLDSKITEDEESELAEVCNNRRVRFDLDEEEEEEMLSHYAKALWARGTTETLVKIGGLETPQLALIDHGSEINIVSKKIYNEGKWPIDKEHGWMIRAANNSRGALYGACPDVSLKIGDVENSDLDEKKAVQFLIVPPNHDRNREYLRKESIPKITEDF
ncbi:hypothetical protein R1sor_014870 [Riccia sorocarpa]|uniref:DUF4100 domain-containing protein n=1 Tax=Riccia sorocarpa TaxID=122646 RepID=A0ABD3HCG8_9MARC